MRFIRFLLGGLLAACALSAGAAHAQTVQRPSVAARPVAVTSPVLRGSWAQDTGTVVVTPVVQVIAQVAKAVTERFIERRISLSGRGGLANVGAYDR